MLTSLGEWAVEAAMSTDSVTADSMTSAADESSVRSMLLRHGEFGRLEEQASPARLEMVKRKLDECSLLNYEQALDLRNWLLKEKGDASLLAAHLVLDGTTDQMRSQFWRAGTYETCCDWFNTGVDDISCSAAFDSVYNKSRPVD